MKGNNLNPHQIQPPPPKKKNKFPRAIKLRYKRYFLSLTLTLVTPQTNVKFAPDSADN